MLPSQPWPLLPFSCLRRSANPQIPEEANLISSHLQMVPVSLALPRSLLSQPPARASCCLMCRITSYLIHRKRDAVCMRACSVRPSIGLLFLGRRCGRRTMCLAWVGVAATRSDPLHGRSSGHWSDWTRQKDTAGYSSLAFGDLAVLFFSFLFSRGDAIFESRFQFSASILRPLTISHVWRFLSARYSGVPTRQEIDVKELMWCDGIE